MAESLNYRPSHSAVYYTPSRRVDLWRTILSVLVAMLLGIAGAVAYAKLQPDMQSLYLRGGAVFAAAFATGILGACAVYFGKVRIPTLAAFIGSIISLLVLYVMWAIWIHDVMWRINLRGAYLTYLTHPTFVVRLMREFN